MEEILDHEDIKIKKQTFAKLALLASLLVVFFWIMMAYQLSGRVRAADSLKLPVSQIIFSLGIVLMSPLSFVFSAISIYQKENWTLVKITGVVLSTIIFLLIVFMILFVLFGVMV